MFTHVCVCLGMNISTHVRPEVRGVNNRVRVIGSFELLDRVAGTRTWVLSKRTAEPSL